MALLLILRRGTLRGGVRNRERTFDILGETARTLGFNHEVAQHFFNAGKALCHQDHRVLLESLHSAAYCHFRDDLRVRTTRNGALEVVCHGEQFVEAHASFVACPAAPVATLSFVEWRGAFAIVSKVPERRLVNFHLLLARLTDAACEALSNDADCGICHQEWLDPHLL